MSHDQDQLTRLLRERAAEVSGPGLDLDTVRGRARRIQRRRQVVAGAVAAVVAAVAVPAGLAVVPQLTGEGAPPVAGSSPAPTPTAARPDGPVALTTEGLSRGEAPGVGYLTAEPALVTRAGTLPLERTYQRVVEYGDGYLALGYAGAGAELFFLDADGRETGTRQPAGERLTVAADRSHVGYVTVEPDGSQTLVSAPTSGADVVTWSFPELPALTPVGFLGDGALVYQTEGESPAVGIARPGDEPRPVPGLLGASDARGDLVAGTVSEQQGAVCSAVLDVSGLEATGGRPDTVWETCDHALGAFSPDGQHLVGYPPYRSGYGDLALTLLEAGTGRPVVEYEQERRRGQVTLTGVAWEDGRTLVAPTLDGERWTILRLGLDGRLENAVEPVLGEAFGDQPYWLTPGA